MNSYIFQFVEQGIVWNSIEGLTKVKENYIDLNASLKILMPILKDWEQRGYRRYLWSKIPSTTRPWMRGYQEWYQKLGSMIIWRVCSVSTTLGDRDNCGSFPDSRNAIDKLDSLLSTGVRSSHFKHLPCNTIWTTCLSGVQCINILNTITSVHSCSVGESCGGKLSTFTRVSWGKEWLKQVKENVFKAFALFDAVDITTPLKVVQKTLIVVSSNISVLSKDSVKRICLPSKITSLCLSHHSCNLISKSGVLQC